MLGKLSLPGRPACLDNRRARAYCACSGRGWGCLDIFLSSVFYLLTFDLIFAYMMNMYHSVL